jgi:glycosyltransferase involved in cell wall biosynthesis
MMHAPDPTSSGRLRVLIVAEHASLNFGGEAALPLHYYRILRRRGEDVWLVVHERTRSELETLFPDDGERIVFVPDTWLHIWLWRLGARLPAQLNIITFGFMLRFLTQFLQRRKIRKLILQHSISVIHQPIPVSPKDPSLIYGMNVPVVIGPMNGGMNYPPAFRSLQSRTDRLALAFGRSLANVMNLLLPGKRRAAVLLVANERTRQALPRGAALNVITLVENGVDLDLWKTVADRDSVVNAAVARFVFVGRLVDWKAVDLLLLAFDRARNRAPMSLTIIGDGNERPALTRMAKELGVLHDLPDVPGTVQFRGWMSQADCARAIQQFDALVLPSLAECGGAVVLEAMAIGLAVIATAWGGPADYLDSSCGILVEPSSREAFIDHLSTALTRLANNPSERIEMGKAGRAKVLACFDWEAKVDEMLTIYSRAVGAQR